MQFLSSIQETDYTTPALKTTTTATEGGIGGYWYYTRFEEGESYPRYCRAPRSSSVDDLYPPPVNAGWDVIITNPNNNETRLGPLLTDEEVYLDVPSLARDKKYLATGAIAISPNQKHVAYTLDERGGETCQLYVRDIESSKVRTLMRYHSNNDDRNDDDDDATAEGDDDLNTPLDAPQECDGSVVWNDVGDALFYVTMDAAHRPYRLYRRRVFDSDGHWIDARDDRVDGDELLMEEEDETFNIRISKSFDGRYLLVRSSSKESSEVHYLDLRPELASSQGGTSPAKNDLVCIAKRRPKVLYRVTHCQGFWLVQTNVGGLPNLSLKACRVGEEYLETWKDVVRYDADAPVPVFDGGHERSLDVSEHVISRILCPSCRPVSIFR